MKTSACMRIIVRTVIFLLVISAVSCSVNNAYVTFFTGQVTIERQGYPPVQVQLKDQVCDGDILKTGKNSCLVIQTAESHIIRLEQNTEAVFPSISGRLKKEIYLNMGKILSVVSKLDKKQEYSIKTVTTIVAVRGTKFLAEYNGRDTIVAVGSGIVNVKHLSGAVDEKSVTDGFTAISEERDHPVFIRGVNGIEKLELSKLDTTPSVDSVEKKTPDELKEIFREPEKQEQQINDEIKELTGLTLGEMKAKYGRVDVLTLFSGRIVRGVIVTRGNVYKIATESGVEMIESKDIKRTDSMKI